MMARPGFISGRGQAGPRELNSKKERRSAAHLVGRTRTQVMFMKWKAVQKGFQRVNVSVTGGLGMV